MEVISENDFLQDNSSEINNNLLHKILKEQNTLKLNDLVIHIDYGIGRFAGLHTIKIEDIENDFIKIDYRDSSSLFVPVETCDLITKYSDYNPNVVLDRLGKGSNWVERKQKIKEQLKKIVNELLSISAKRKLVEAQIFNINDGEFEEFCNNFPFKMTADQEKAFEEIRNDLASGKVMDRLLCGDVGFGKTEVAIRASFLVASSRLKAQVAVIVPTTLLCRQHFKKFTERFENTAVKIASLSRFTSASEKKKILDELKSGKIDLIIGTHAVLGKNVSFKNLGLVVIDEEQSFGVLQKEKLKELRYNCHILSMSATPIPRTLQLSLAGIRDLSLIMTPPTNRIAIDNYVLDYDSKVIKEAIEREISRDGRVFFVVPRIADIREVESRLELIISNEKFYSVHGQMKNEHIDKIMNDFYDGKFRVLITTTIIESGIDIPMANTMFIYRANNFGLAQLYQLRGRVGRSDRQAYVYLITKKNDILTETAKRRLGVIENIKNLNSGFTISSEDMDVRGAGNIIGEEQSGHIKEVGIELYNQLLKDAVKNEKNELINNLEELDFSPDVKLSLSTTIPNNYISNINIKMKFYRRIANINSIKEKEKIEKELLENYGAFPNSVNNLLKLSILRVLCKELNIQKLEKKDNDIFITFYRDKFSKPEKLIDLSFKQKEHFKIRQNKLVYSNKINCDIFDYTGKLLSILKSL